LVGKVTEGEACMYTKCFLHIHHQQRQTGKHRK